MEFTQKETLLLQDLKKYEQTCIEKYNKYSNEATDTNLKTMFSQIGQKEQQHLDTINQLISGTVPSVNSNQSGQSQSNTSNSTQPLNTNTANYNKQNDSFLCTDALSTEKHVSSSYNTSIFEFSDKNVRNVLNHIQKEEQEHGEQIYNYMSQNGMYS